MAQRVSQPAARALLALGGSSPTTITGDASPLDTMVGGRSAPAMTGGARGSRCQQPSYGGETIGTMATIGRHAINWCQPQDSLGLPWWLHGK